MSAKKYKLDDSGTCVAEEIKPGLWAIRQQSTIITTAKKLQTKTVYLTADTIQWLAGKVGQGND